MLLSSLFWKSIETHRGQEEATTELSLGNSYLSEGQGSADIQVSALTDINVTITLISKLVSFGLLMSFLLSTYFNI